MAADNAQSTIYTAGLILLQCALPWPLNEAQRSYEAGHNMW